MKSALRSCANCSSYDPVRGCWAWINGSQQADSQQALSRPSTPDGWCKNHNTRLESDALDAAIYALWEPLLIKSRWTAERSKGRRDSE